MFDSSIVINDITTVIITGLIATAFIQVFVFSYFFVNNRGFLNCPDIAT